MKKFLTCLIVAGLFLGGLFTTNIFAKEESDKLKVTVSIYPIYDWVREVVGERSDQVDLALLLDSGIDLHSYQASVDDIVRISESDLFIYVGGHSDDWVPDALAQAKEGQKTINLVEALGDDAKAEEIVEGMEHHHDHEHEYEDAEAHEHEHEHEHEDAEEAHEHDHEHEHEDAEEAHEHDHEHEHSHHHHEDEIDEHVWLSLKYAQVFVQEIADHLSELDPEGAEAYQANAAVYIKKLQRLDRKYAKAVEESDRTTLVIADRFPFRYLFDDYKLDYYAAFSGCSTESDASFETVTFLADKIKELDLNTILVIENSKQKIAKAINETAGGDEREVLVLDSLQSLASDDLDEVDSYLETMRLNLEVLKKALD